MRYFMGTNEADPDNIESCDTEPFIDLRDTIPCPPPKMEGGPMQYPTIPAIPRLRTPAIAFKSEK